MEGRRMKFLTSLFTVLMTAMLVVWMFFAFILVIQS